MTNRQGRMNRTTGIMILTGTWAAFSSARWRRLTRISADCTRSTWPIGMPKESACTMAPTKDLRSARLGPFAEAAHGVRPAAADLHLLQHPLNSSASGPSVFLATCCSAASKPRPASTEIVSRSMASAMAFCMLLARAWWRCCRARCSGAWKPMPRADGGHQHAHRAATGRGSPKATNAPTAAQTSARGSCRRGPGRRSTRPGCRPGPGVRRIRSSWSAPEMRRPMFWNRWSSGVENRSPKRSLELGGECSWGHHPGSRASRAIGSRRGSGRSSSRRPRRSGRARRRPSGHRSRSTIVLHLHLHHAAHQERAIPRRHAARPTSMAQPNGYVNSGMM